MLVKESPNKDRLTYEEMKLLEEEDYRIRHKGSWGFAPGDPRLKSSDKIVTEEKD